MESRRLCNLYYETRQKRRKSRSRPRKKWEVGIKEIPAGKGVEWSRAKETAKEKD